jgi:hypothetical protein
VGTGPPHGEPRRSAPANASQGGDSRPDTHDWWTPDHPEDGLSWEEPVRERRAQRMLRATRRGRNRVAAIHRRRLALLAAGLAIVIVVAVVVLGGGGTTVTGPPLPGLGRPAPSGDPFAYSPADQAAFASRAAIGNAQVLFTKSPGGVLASAARVEAFRPLIDAAVKGTKIPADVLEAIVLLESAGRTQVIAGTSPAAASGLTQILAVTGQSLLGMHINLATSTRLTNRIETAAADGNGALTARLEAHRAAVDDRFVPAKALAATVRYLQIGEQNFHRLDLAVESYHMGIGNLQHVLADFDDGHPVPFAQVYFGSTPNDHASTYDLLGSFSDDSELYYWRVLGAEMIMHLYRTDRAALAHLTQLELSFPSNALVLVPPGRVTEFSNPAALSAAYHTHELLPLPRNAARLGLSYSPSMGAFARKLKVPRSLYAGLRPAALDLLIELVARVRAISDVRAPLTVASTVADARYEKLTGFTDPPALTGYTFQIERRYASPAVADAFQSMLDRLQSLNLIAWIRGTSTIEITVAPDADSVLAHGIQ